MNKYTTLRQYISKTKNDWLELTFEEIEKILGFPINHSFLKFKKELKNYNWKVQKISLKDKYIIFIKIK